jgi:DNA-binding transcriptional LysR family regulator
MSAPDFNLLLTLDAVLSEGSVARAARRLRLSPSAMSRALARLRETTGDPLLVRAGRGLVPTPRALELREQVGQLVQDIQSVLRPVEMLDLSRLTRIFTIRASDGFVESFGPELIERVGKEAPGVQLRFVSKQDKDSTVLRDGSIDLDTGVIGPETQLEIRTQALFRDRFVGVVRRGHPLSDGEVTAARYAAGRHVFSSRRGLATGRIDETLAVMGLERRIVTIVGGFAAALTFARATDLIATVPERYTHNLRDGMFSFPLPLAMPEFTISLMWHPRLDADLAHKWLRRSVRDVCAGVGVASVFP